MPKQFTLTAYLSLLRLWSQGIASPRVVNKLTHVSMNYFLFLLTGSGIHYWHNTILTVLFSEVRSWTVLLLLGCSQWCFHLSWEEKTPESIINVFLLHFSMSITAATFTEYHKASQPSGPHVTHKELQYDSQAGDAFHNQRLYSCNLCLRQEESWRSPWKWERRLSWDLLQCPTQVNLGVEKWDCDYSMYVMYFIWLLVCTLIKFSMKL